MSYPLSCLDFSQKMTLKRNKTTKVHWCLKIDILFPKLFWPTVRENCSSDRENLLKFKAEAENLITWTIYSNSERSENFLVTECFFHLFLGIQAVWRRGRLSPRLLRPDLWCRLEVVTIDAKDIWRLIGMWHLTPSDIWRQCEFSDICRRTFNARLDFQTFVARTFNARHLTPIEFSDICRPDI